MFSSVTIGMIRFLKLLVCLFIPTFFFTSILNSQTTLQNVIAVFDLDYDTVDDDKYNLSKIIPNSLSSILKTIPYLEVLSPDETEILKRYSSKLIRKFSNKNEAEKIDSLSYKINANYIIYGSVSGEGRKNIEVTLYLYDSYEGEIVDYVVKEIKNIKSFKKLRKKLFHSLFELMEDKNIINYNRMIKKELNWLPTKKLDVYNKYLISKSYVDECNYKMALDILETAIKEDATFIDGLLLYGDIHFLLGNYMIAFDKYQSILNLIEKKHSLEFRQQQTRYYKVLQSIGKIYQTKAVYEKAIQYYQKAQRMAERYNRSYLLQFERLIDRVIALKGERKYVKRFVNLLRKIRDNCYDRFDRKNINIVIKKLKKSNISPLKSNIFYDNLIRIISKIEFLYIDNYLFIGEVERLRGNLSKSMQIYREGLSILRRQGKMIKRAKFYDGIAHNHLVRGEFKQALASYSESSLIYEDYGLILSLIENIIDRSMVNRLLKEDVKSSEHVEEAYNMLKKIDHPKTDGKLFSEIGSVYELKSLLEKENGNDYKADDFFKIAIKYHRKALNVYDDIQYRYGFANTLTNLGIAYYSNGDYKKAISWIEKALRFDKEHGLLKELGKDLNNLALIYTAMSEYDRAIKFFDSAMEVRRRIDDKLGLSITYNSVGLLYVLKDLDYEIALKYFDKSLSIMKEIKHKDGIAKLYSLIGNLYTQKGEYDRALRMYYSALDFYKELNQNEYDRIKKLVDEIEESKRGY